ncbi:hypothetical protein VFPFJ_10055 [Purpureocillium lilacinum]|uniref:Uncharacterized protein n=1 Tax=Purpureocillium lilacinum TaxID=33203 RepID=A0A179GL30_PURLI|nr:hypothetical protein VFPFJ_10055 [Purpureocillium lilacinum]OAQ78023.1 hypothetical protein VFPFJ_10055 [Purpureocillium lilacinum]
MTLDSMDDAIARNGASPAIVPGARQLIDRAVAATVEEPGWAYGHAAVHPYTAMRPGDRVEGPQRTKMPCRNPWASRDLRPVFFYRDAKGSIALLEHAPIGRPSDWEIHAWIKHNRMHVWACAWAAQQRSGSVGSPRRCPLCSSRRLTDSSDAPELSPQRLAPVGDGQEPSAKSLLGGPLAPRTCGILLGEWLGVMRLGPTPDPHRHHEEWRAAEHQPSSP